MCREFKQLLKQVAQIYPKTISLKIAVHKGCLSGLFFLLLFVSCSQSKDTLFTQLEPSQTGIDFINKNVDSDSLSMLDYLYYYNGAGVAIGDINNDSLPDLYFTSNTGGNKLYLNKGHFKFEDITLAAGVTGASDWTTGVTMVDINEDGFLDIYVSTVANHKPGNNDKSFFKNSRNQLFINNRNNTFTENGASWGLAIQGYNTQAVFFDYDKDGDLDLFQLQHSVHQTDSYGSIDLRNNYSEVNGAKLFRNDGAAHFTNVTKGSGIISSALGFGLGAAVADINQDGYDDIYVSNDFHENDYYYLNQGNGTFKEINAIAFGHESKFSMGNDIADINNDGWPDLMTTDMLPTDEKILKSSLGDDAPDIYALQRSFGYSNQYSRNCLQLNTGRGMQFADIALYSGVAGTDWSWSPLIADYNLDGYADIFISTGIKKRPNDLDYIKFITNLPQNSSVGKSKENDKKLLAQMPGGKWQNYIFEGSASLKFKNQSNNWGFEKATLSQGAAYADLDGDGDLDLITNNMNEPAGIYKNNTIEKNKDINFLTITLRANSGNTFAIGAKVFLFADSLLLYKQVQNSKGFMSSSDLSLSFGLGNKKRIDSLLIIWPNNRYQIIKSIQVNRRVNISYDRENTDSLLSERNFIGHLLGSNEKELFADITEKSGVHYKHEEDSYVDFNDQWSIPHQLSTQGPRIAVGDVNKDGLEDFFICGARNQSGQVFLQQKDGRFKASADSALFVADKDAEDVDADFIDVDMDGDLDLYIVSGGNIYAENNPLLKDRLYINIGKGHFVRSSNLPDMRENKSVVRVADIDKDGDPDLFIGGRSISGNYSKIPASYLLINDGQGKFNFSADSITDSLNHLGMVTDAAWIDIDNDSWPDLVIVGEWMQPLLFINKKGKLIKSALTNNDLSLSGWWCSIKTGDLNGDGYDDLLIGNYGLNSKLTANKSYPIKMYSKDFSENGKIDHLLAIEKEKKYYTFLNKEEIEKQLPFIRKKFLKYGEMAGKTVEEVFGDRLNNAKIVSANTFASLVLLNDGTGKYIPSLLPSAFQWAPLFAFGIDDYNKDGKIDILAGGNFFGTTPYEGRYDAIPLTLGIGDGQGIFHPTIPIPLSFENIRGEIRSIQPIKLANRKKGLLIAINNNRIMVLEY
ncbi:MAG: VCBS repeat-containing protein [Chitinophagaceae bacterium]